MAKSISQIRNEISNFYLAIQDQVTDVSTGSVAGGLIYAFSSALKQLYDDLESLEDQAYIPTATGTYLDLLIEGGFFLSRPDATRSSGYILVYGDDAITNPTAVGNSLICADYDYETQEFTANLSAATRFRGINSLANNEVSYALITPRESQYVKTDSLGRKVIDLKGKQAQYFILPVASVLTGSQVNVDEGDINIFDNPPSGLNYVINTNNPGEFLFNSSGVSSAPLYSRNTSMTFFNPTSNIFSVVNAFNFSSSGFLEISYKASAPTTVLSAVYENETLDQISGGLVFSYQDKTQTSITLSSSDVANPFIKTYSNNVLSTYNIVNFTYNNVSYYVDTTDSGVTYFWYSSTDTTLPDSTVISGSDLVVGNSTFFSKFFSSDSWILQQRREQVSQDIIFDPDSALTDAYLIKDGYRISTAVDEYSDSQYRDYFKKYVAGLPRGTGSSLEAASLQVDGITFSKVIPSFESPPGVAVLLAADNNGTLSLQKKQEVIDYLEDDWVSAGVNLLVRAPDLVQMLISVSVTLTNPSLESFVTRTLTDSISAYLLSKEPGDEIKYGEIYSLISRSTGVKNVSKLIIGKYDPDHYEDYRHNYADVALEHAVLYSSDYSLVDDITFRDSRNEIVISTDVNNGNYLNPVSFTDYNNILNSSSIFNNFNTKFYGAVEGVFSSDGGGSINPSAHTVSNVYQDSVGLSSSNVIGISFTTDAPSVPVTISANGNTVISSDTTAFRSSFLSVPSGSTDVSISFSSASSANISGIQIFIHDVAFETHLIGEYALLENLPFIQNSKINIVYSSTTKSSRVKTLELINSNTGSYESMKSFISAMIAADSLSLYQNILRDYQYGLNNTGKNSAFYSNFFADTSQTDRDFKYFFIYATTGPLSAEFKDNYPINPSSATNSIISDYTLQSTELTRFRQSLIKPLTKITPALGIDVN